MAARHKEKNFAKAGRLINLSSQQARRRWDRVRDMILAPTEYPDHDDLHIAGWMILHGECCCAPAWDLIENDSRFAS